MVQTEILDFIVPEALMPGSEVNVRVKLRNADTVPGYVEYIIDGNPVDPDKYVAVEGGSSHPVSVSPGETMWLDVHFRYFDMPDWDFNLIATNYEGTSTISRTILVGEVPEVPEVPEVTWMLMPAAVGLGLVVTGRA